jgi:transcriptional regulator with XRE-family HTH domain
MTDQEFNEELGLKLRKLRKQRGLTLHQLATMTQAHKTTVMRVEKGEVSPSTNLLRKIAIALDVPTEELLGATA